MRRLGAGGDLLWTDMLPGVRVNVEDRARVLAAGCESAVAFTGDVMGPFVFTLWVGAYSAEGARTWSYLRASDEGASGQQIAGAHAGDVIVSGNVGSYPWLGQLATLVPRANAGPSSAGCRKVAARSASGLLRTSVGMMGVVYAAFDPELDRKVALKFLRADASDLEGRARLLREA